MSTSPKPVQKIGTDRIFCCPLLPETALATLLQADNPSPSPLNPASPTNQQIYDAHVPINTQLTFPANPLIWMLRNFMVWAESHDKGELDFMRKLEAEAEWCDNIEGAREKCIRALHCLRIECFKEGEEKLESVQFFLPLFDASPDLKEGDVRRICRFVGVPWEVVEVVDVKAVRELAGGGEGFSCFCGGGVGGGKEGKVYKCAYVGEIKIDNSVLDEEGRGEEMKYQVGWGVAKSKVIERVKDTLDFGWGWS